MVVITADIYADAGVNTITIENEELFWVKMIDVQNGVGLKDVCQLVRVKLQGMYETKDLTEEQKKKYIWTKKEKNNKKFKNDFNCKYIRSDLMQKNN